MSNKKMGVIASALFLLISLLTSACGNSSSADPLAFVPVPVVREYVAGGFSVRVETPAGCDLSNCMGVAVLGTVTDEELNSLTQTICSLNMGEEFPINDLLQGVAVYDVAGLKAITLSCVGYTADAIKVKKEITLPMYVPLQPAVTPESTPEP